MFRRFRVEGHSMEPTLRLGSSVVIWKTKNVKAGDIIAFKYSGIVMIKRVKEVRVEGTFKVVGDNAADSSPIPPITSKEIIGRMVFRYR